MTKLEEINAHREALGYPLFEHLTPEELDYHLNLIEAKAPFGDDPWEDEASE